MIKTALNLIAVALVAYATWNLFTAYSAHYKFRDSVENALQFGGEQSEEQLRRRVLELAEQFDLPLASDGFTLHREDKHTISDGSYLRPVDVLPGLSYPWSFTWHVDTFTVKAPKLDSVLPGTQ